MVERMTLKNRELALQKYIKSLKQENQKLKNRLEGIKSLEKQLSKWINLCDKKVKKTKELEKDNLELRTTVANMTKDYHKKMEEIERLKSFQNKDTKNIIEEWLKVQEDNDDLEYQIEQLKNEIDRLKNENNEIRWKWTDLGLEIKQLKKEILAKQKVIDILKRDNKQFENEIENNRRNSRSKERFIF
jgi:chromosome segregation ATPase